MKESAKRILALVLSFVMIFTSLPIIADAVDEDLFLKNQGNTNEPTFDVSFYYSDGTAKMYLMKNDKDFFKVKDKEGGSFSTYFGYKSKTENEFRTVDSKPDIKSDPGQNKPGKKPKDGNNNNNNNTEDPNSNVYLQFRQPMPGFYMLTFTKNKETYKWYFEVKSHNYDLSYDVKAYCDDVKLDQSDVTDATFKSIKVGDLTEEELNTYIVDALSQFKDTFVKGDYEYTLISKSAKYEYNWTDIFTIYNLEYSKSSLSSFKNDLKLSNDLNKFESKIDKNISKEIYKSTKNNVENLKVGEFVNDKFEDGDYIYTLANGDTKVSVVANKDEEDIDYNVVIEPTYNKQAKPCYEKIVVKYMQGDAGINGVKVSRNEIFVNKADFEKAGKEDYVTKENKEFDKNSDFNLLKYFKNEITVDGVKYVLDTKETEVVLGQLDKNRTRTVTITPVYNKEKVVVTFMYENTKLYEATISSKDKKLTKEQKDAATQAAKQLEEDDETHSFKFKKFVDAQGAEVKIDGPQGKAFNENTTLYAVYETKLKGSKFVKFGYYDANDNFVEVEPKDKKVENEILNKESNKAEFIKRTFARDIGNKVVNEISIGNEIKVIYNVLTYQAKFICDNEEVKTDDTIYYVVDRDMDEAKEDEENANKIIKDNKLDANFTIENTTDVAKYTKKFDIVASATELLKDIKLFFTKGFVDPVEVVHQLHFHDVEIDGVQQNYKQEIKTETVEKPENKANLYDMYIGLALGDYVLDNVNGNNEAITKDGDKVVFNYRARMIRVTYKVLGLDGKEDKTKGYTKASYVKFNEFNVKDETSLKALVDKVIKDKDDIEGYKFKEAEELDKKKIDDLIKKYPARPVESKDKNDWSDTNVVEITLVYEADPQYFCDHKYEYVNMGDYHKHICPKCEKFDDEDHEFDPDTHKCVCGAEDPNRVRTIENIKIKLPEGVVVMSADKLYDYTVDKAPAAIAEAINDMEEDEMSELPAGTTYDDVDNEDVVKVLTNNFDFAEHWYMDNDGYVVKDINITSPLEYFYKVRVEFVRVEGKFNQVEIKNDLRYDSVYNTIAQEVRRQKETNSCKLPEKFDVSLFDEQGNKLSPDKAALEYGKVYAVEVVFNRFDGQTELDRVEFTGKVHLYHGSSKKKKKNTDLPDGLLPQGGAGIADLRTNRPDDMLTRSEFIGVLSEIFSVLDTENYKDFTDINGDANEQAIKQLSSFGIVQGYCEDTFGPNDFITREQMYTFIARALKFSGKASQLTDEQINAALSKVLDNENVADWAKDGVATSIEKELVNETEKAQDTIKRVEAADKLEKFAAILFTEEEIK